MQTEWIPFKEKMPNRRKFKEILTFGYVENIDSKKLLPLIVIEDTREIIKYKGKVFAQGEEITHWMELPKTPTLETQNTSVYI